MNTEKFTGKAAIYTQYRPSYPQEFIDYLYTEVGINSASVIADVGSGTGILSKQLLDRGSKVVGVEPNADMRHSAESTLLEYPKFVSVNGTAEWTSLPEQSVDYITVAQAFHWFDEEKFRVECHRILKPEGKVVLVWNSRVTNSELVVKNGEICRRLCLNFTGFSGGREENPESFYSFFRNGSLDFRVFENDLVFDQEGFIGRNLSASYALKETDPNYHQYVDELTDLFNEYSVDGKLTLPNVTRSYVGFV